MDIDNRATHHVSLPLSSAAAQFGRELDVMMKSVSDISLLSVPAKSQEIRISLTKNSKASGDVECDEDWALDTRNPRNWPQRKKWAAISVVSSHRPFFNWDAQAHTFPCDMIGLSLYRRRRHCQLYDGTCFAANRNSISYR
jgi:hypothetical protein